MPYLRSRGGKKRRRPQLRPQLPSERTLRFAYRISAADAWAQGERPLSYAQYKRLVRQQLAMAAIDPGGNIVL